MEIPRVLRGVEAMLKKKKIPNTQRVRDKNSILTAWMQIKVQYAIATIYVYIHMYILEE